MWKRNTKLFLGLGVVWLCGILYFTTNHRPNGTPTDKVSLTSHYYYYSLHCLLHTKQLTNAHKTRIELSHTVEIQ
jgi:hypothetical protein